MTKIQNKKGISTMVSYTLLIVIAVGLSVGVYAYLKLYLPSARPECPSGISLITEDIVCSSGTLTLSLTNRGLFNVSAAFIRMAPTDRTVRDQVNSGYEIFIQGPIAPGETGEPMQMPTEPSEASGPYIIEIQPAIISEGTLYPCSKGTITTQPVICEV